jgi:hypothetical protein
VTTQDCPLATLNCPCTENGFCEENLECSEGKICAATQSSTANNSSPVLIILIVVVLVVIIVVAIIMIFFILKRKKRRMNNSASTTDVELSTKQGSNYGDIDSDIYQPITDAILPPSLQQWKIDSNITLGEELGKGKKKNQKNFKFDLLTFETKKNIFSTQNTQQNFFLFSFPFFWK